MAITDIDISEELVTNAPSIKYTGNEGPKSPQEEQQMKMAQLEEVYSQYVEEMIEQGIEPMSLQQFIEQAMAEGQMSGGNPLPSDPTKPVNPFGPKPTGPVLPNRQMAAYGGMMGRDGRRRYGLGSFVKDTVRKIIPNEVAEIAEKAAPFIALAAPQFALPAAIAGGLGRFDRTGSIGDSLKSGLMTYGLGTLSPGLPGVRDMGPQSGMFTTQPFGGKYNVSNLFKSKPKIAPSQVDNVSKVIPTDQGDYGIFGEKIKETASSGVKGLTDKIKDYVMNNKLATFLLAKEGMDLLGGGPEKTVSEIMSRGEGLDIAGIRAEVQEAFKDESGEKLLALRTKYPFLGKRETKDLSAMAMGGRIGYGLGNLVRGSAIAQPTSDSMSAGNAPSFEGGSGMGGMIADLIRKNPQIFSGAQNNSSVTQNTGMEKMFSKFFRNPRMYDKDFIDENFNYIDDREEAAMGGRIGMAEGGIMDLGGMEKDYRAEGGFVPIGKAEKADDVPARLSVNEFVFTADAVRNAGGGDIDKGAEIMENMMKNLEAGGQVSEESQGMAGAQQMFETSERLSEVI